MKKTSSILFYLQQFNYITVQVLNLCAAFFLHKLVVSLINSRGKPHCNELRFCVHSTAPVKSCKQNDVGKVLKSKQIKVQDIV